MTDQDLRKQREEARKRAEKALARVEELEAENAILRRERDELKQEKALLLEPLRRDYKRLSDFIVEKFPDRIGSLGAAEGPVDTAIMLLNENACLHRRSTGESTIGVLEKLKGTIVSKRDEAQALVDDTGGETAGAYRMWVAGLRDSIALVDAKIKKLEADTPPPPAPDAEIERLKKQMSAQSHCQWPEAADLDWMEVALQRHTGGAEPWWQQNKQYFTFRDAAEIFICVWEAGRSVRVARGKTAPPPPAPLGSGEGAETSPPLGSHLDCRTAELPSWVATKADIAKLETQIKRAGGDYAMKAEVRELQDSFRRLARWTLNMHEADLLPGIVRRQWQELAGDEDPPTRDVPKGEGEG